MRTPPTIILDIDGTLFRFEDQLVAVSRAKEPHLLDGTCKRILDWYTAGYRILILTGRPEAWRKQTEEQLAHHGIIYEQLIMGVGSGPRILINDRNPDYPSIPMATGITLDRDLGIKDLNIEEIVYGRNTKE